MQLVVRRSPKRRQPAPSKTLQQVGVFYRHLSTDAEAYRPAIVELCQRGYTARDEVSLSPSTPNLSTLLDKFKTAPAR